MGNNFSLVLKAEVQNHQNQSAVVFAKIPVLGNLLGTVPDKA